MSVVACTREFVSLASKKGVAYRLCLISCGLFSPSHLDVFYVLDRKEGVYESPVPRFMWYGLLSPSLTWM